MRHSIKPSTHVSKKSRAFHEAGHAVIARVEGIQITEATILPGFIQSERVLGSVEFIFGRTDDHEAKIRALLAGAIAQERAGFIDRIGGMQDRFEVEKLAGIWANRLKPGELLRDCFDEDGSLSLSVDEEARAMRLVKRLQKQTETLVARHWLAIERVADALLRRRVLYQDDVDASAKLRRRKWTS